MQITNGLQQDLLDTFPSSDRKAIHERTSDYAVVGIRVVIAQVELERRTQNALSAHCEGLDDITSRADSRVEKDGQPSGSLGSTDFARAHDLVKRVQGANCAV